MRMVSEARPRISRWTLEPILMMAPISLTGLATFLVTILFLALEPRVGIRGTIAVAVVIGVLVLALLRRRRPSARP